VAIFFGIDVEYNERFVDENSNNSSVAFNLVAFSGVYVNPNSFGTFLLIFISSTLYLLGFVKSRFLSFILLILCVLSFFFLVSTLNRAAILGFVILWFMLFVFYRHKVSVIIVLVSSFAVFMSLYFVLDLEVLSSLAAKFEGSGSNGRSVIWLDALKSVKEHLFFGVGYYDYYGFSAHNSFLQVMANWGVVVFSLWFFVYFCFIVNSVLLSVFLVRVNVFSTAVVVGSILAIFARSVFSMTIAEGYNLSVMYLWILGALAAKELYGEGWVFKLSKFKSA